MNIIILNLSKDDLSKFRITDKSIYLFEDIVQVIQFKFLRNDFCLLFYNCDAMDDILKKNISLLKEC